MDIFVDYLNQETWVFKVFWNALHVLPSILSEKYTNLIFTMLPALVELLIEKNMKKNSLNSLFNYHLI